MRKHYIIINYDESHRIKYSLIFHSFKLCDREWNSSQFSIVSVLIKK